MLIVMAEVEVEPGSIERIRDALREMEEASRREPGCLLYAFSVDVSDPGRVRISERWESLEALEQHFATPHMAAFGASVAKIRPRSMNVTLYEVARELPMPR